MAGGGYFGEQGLPVGIHDCLERFHRYLSRQCVPKWDSPNGESELVTADTTSLLVECIVVVAYPLAGLRFEGELHREFQKTMDNLEHGY